LALGSHAFKISFPRLAIIDFEVNLLHALKLPIEGEKWQKYAKIIEKSAKTAVFEVPAINNHQRVA
jgi:hypothetical protein